MAISCLCAAHTRAQEGLYPECFLEGLVESDFAFVLPNNQSTFTKWFTDFFPGEDKSRGIEFLCNNIKLLHEKAPSIEVLFYAAEKLNSKELVFHILDYCMKEKILIPDSELVPLTYWLPKILPIFHLVSPPKKEANENLRIENKLLPSLSNSKLTNRRAAKMAPYPNFYINYAKQLEGVEIRLLYQYCSGEISEEVLNRKINTHLFEAGSFYPKLLVELDKIKNEEY